VLAVSPGRCGRVHAARSWWLDLQDEAGFKTSAETQNVGIFVQALDPSAVLAALAAALRRKVSSCSIGRISRMEELDATDINRFIRAINGSRSLTQHAAMATSISCSRSPHDDRRLDPLKRRSFQSVISSLLEQGVILLRAPRGKGELLRRIYGSQTCLLPF
jgi:hypothetical protein